MSVARARDKRSLAFTLALAVILTLAVPFATPAIAQVTNDNTLGLEGQPETDTNPVGTNHTITATLYTQTISGNTGDTGVANCTRAVGCEVQFEIESGPAVTVVSETPAVSGNTAGRTTDSDNSPTSPDMECLIANGTNSCSVVISSATQGDNIIRLWVDDDRNNTTVDADLAEGRNAGNSDCVAGTPNPQPAGFTADTAGNCSPTGAAVGDRAERDDTDVIQKTWFTAAVTNVRLDCDDDDTTDTEANAPGATERYTCNAFDTKGTASLEDDTGVSGQVIDAENLGGANDPDNGFTNATADFSACTTGADGTCTFDLVPTENETGVANVCFWIDEDNDNGFSTTGGEFDGGECDAAGEWTGGAINTGTPTLDEYPATPQPANRTDPVQKTWAQPAATTLDATPERDSNLKGTSHTISATVTDQFGGPIANVGVDFRLVAPSANLAQGLVCDQVLTNALGVATCPYTDSTTVVGPEPEVDTILACVDATDNDVCDADDLAVDETTEAEFTNLGDRVEKFWFTTLPTAATVRVDMDADDGCTADDPTTPDNVVETNHAVCGTALSSTGATVAGVNVDLSLSGPGFFTSGQGTATRADDPNLGTSITVTTDSSGVWRATITSLATGTTTLTATSGSASDTGTKTWTALANARNIDCEPETDTNPPGTSHVITCTATDRLGNAVPGELISATETGPGRFDSDNTNVAANVNGVVEFVVNTTLNEEGTQTIVASLDQDADDTTPLTRTAEEQQDECDLLAGNPAATGESPAAPAGNCADEVTKVWDADPTPLAECEDEIDNDGDGDIDFPADAGCESATDDSESDLPVECAGEGTIAGTDGADVLNGTAGDDVICGFGGNDTLNGLGGNDVLLGGGGDDELNGGDGADSIEGDVVAACLQTGCADGNDTADGGGGKDTIRGHGGNDLLLGGNKNDLMVGGQGNDTLRGQNGWDTIRGNAGDDRLIGNKGNDILQGGVGNDLAQGGGGNDTIRGFTGRDNLRGGGGSDIIKGGSGRDQLRGGRGPDILDGGAGRDACFGGPGDDTLRRCE